MADILLKVRWMFYGSKNLFLSKCKFIFIAHFLTIGSTWFKIQKAVMVSSTIIKYSFIFRFGLLFSCYWWSYLWCYCRTCKLFCFIKNYVFSSKILSFSAFNWVNYRWTWAFQTSSIYAISNKWVCETVEFTNIGLKIKYF